MVEQKGGIYVAELLGQHDLEMLRSRAQVAIRWAAEQGLIAADSQPTETILSKDLTDYVVGSMVDDMASGVHAGATAARSLDPMAPRGFFLPEVKIVKEWMGGWLMPIEVRVGLKGDGNLDYAIVELGSDVGVKWDPSIMFRMMDRAFVFLDNVFRGVQEKRKLYEVASPDRLVELMKDLFSHEVDRQLVGKRKDEIEAWVLDYLGIKV